MTKVENAPGIATDHADPIVSLTDKHGSKIEVFKRGSFYIMELAGDAVFKYELAKLQDCLKLAHFLAGRIRGRASIC